MDAWIAAILVPLSVWLLISGVDDLILDLLCGFHWICRKLNKRKLPRLTGEQLRAQPERKIAIFVPLWREHRVIANMVKHNLAAIDYQNFHIFIGAYPNDQPTLAAVRDLERLYANVHLAMVPHDGPTSKADCLNWIYQRILEFEEQRQVQFDIVMTHDAEDLIHPASLRLVNYYSDRYDMVQVPVVPLPTPVWMATHGVYCDEFCETQTRDMPARGFFGAFVPSCGVGTSFSRAALKRLAAAESNRIFEPVCLTEDYENGIRVHALGGKQIFIPLRRVGDSVVATREYFPQTFRTAVKQRTRWVMGIALQTWERHGWQGDWIQKYWLWRDRKGLIGNPLSLLTNGVCIYGLTTLAVARWQGQRWGLGEMMLPQFGGLLTCTGMLGIIRMMVRAFCVARIFGWWFAAWVPIRTLYANLINSAATVQALWRYGNARALGRPLVWLKTEHAYPSQTALRVSGKRLGEVLLAEGYVTPDQLEVAVATQREGVRLGEHMLMLGLLAERDLYDALSVQQGLPRGRVYAQQVKKAVARSLPARVMEQWHVLPFRVEPGHLYVAGTQIPTEEMERDLRRFTNLEIRFQLITPSNYDELARELL